MELFRTFQRALATGLYGASRLVPPVVAKLLFFTVTVVSILVSRSLEQGHRIRVNKNTTSLLFLLDSATFLTEITLQLFIFRQENVVEFPEFQKSLF